MNPLRLITSLFIVALASLMATVRQTASRIETVTLGTPANASTTAVHAAVTDNGTTQTITTAITNPTTPRSVTATAGGTGANITAVKVKVEGTNANGDVITEELPAFTAATPGTVEGSKAFATITKITVPANGAGVTTAIGTGNKFGLPFKLSRNTIVAAFVNGVKEGTAPTVVASASAIENNTVKLNSAPAGTEILLDFYR